MKVKIKELFEAYETQINNTPDVRDVFSKSGMINPDERLELGFFSLGSGILEGEGKINEAEIETGGIMILGNDFGTTNYLKTQCKNLREDNSRTIKNLERIGLNIEKTFFTNFFLGLRNNQEHPDMTMTKLVVERKKEYKKFCYAVFLTQLEIINPNTVICIGKEVGFALYEFFEDVFVGFDKKNVTYKKLFENKGEYEIVINNSVLGKRKFLFIPHPSWAHINWKNHNIESKIKIALKN